MQNISFPTESSENILVSQIENPNWTFSHWTDMGLYPKRGLHVHLGWWKVPIFSSRSSSLNLMDATLMDHPSHLEPAEGTCRGIYGELLLVVRWGSKSEKFLYTCKTLNRFWCFFFQSWQWSTIHQAVIKCSFYWKGKELHFNGTTIIEFPNKLCFRHSSDLPVTAALNDAANCISKATTSPCFVTVLSLHQHSQNNFVSILMKSPFPLKSNSGFILSLHNSSFKPFLSRLS